MFLDAGRERARRPDGGGAPRSQVQNVVPCVEEVESMPSVPGGIYWGYGATTCMACRGHSLYFMCSKQAMCIWKTE